MYASILLIKTRWLCWFCFCCCYGYCCYCWLRLGCSGNRIGVWCRESCFNVLLLLLLCSYCTDISDKGTNSIGWCWYINSKCMRSSGRWHWFICYCKLCWLIHMYWKKYFQRFQRLNFVNAVNTAVPAELWFKYSYVLNLPEMAEYLQFTLGDTIRPY